MHEDDATSAVGPDTYAVIDNDHPSGRRDELEENRLFGRHGWPS
jgi:hypothetical protein